MHPPIVSREERRALLFRCLSNVRDPEAISGWFFGVPLGALHRENLRDWILWALFSADRLHRSEILQQYGEEIEEYVHDFEKMVGREFPEGRNESVRSMRVTLDPVSMLHRPLVWYTVRSPPHPSPFRRSTEAPGQIVMIVDTITTASLYHAGFSHCAAKRWFNVFPPRPLSLLARQRPLHPQLSYWFRPARQPSKRAVLFLHGLGVRSSLPSPLLV